jgi:hypothetical protein
VEISTVTQRLTVLSLTDDEVEHYIAHPNELSLDLIKSGNRTGHIGRIPVVAPSTKTKPEKPGKKNSVKRGRKSGELFSCKHCTREFKKAGNRDNHEATCADGLEIGTHQPGD